MKIHEQNLKQFWRFITERHVIYKKKNIEKLPPPWTLDPILREYKFTNVFRDLDPGTRYVIERLTQECLSFRPKSTYVDEVEKSLKNSESFNKESLGFARDDNKKELSDLLFNLCIYRLYNKPSTSDAVGWQEVGKFDRKIFEKKLRDLKATGEKVFTNAYLVSGYEQYASHGDKIARTSKLLEDIAERIPGVMEGIVSSVILSETKDLLQKSGLQGILHCALLHSEWHREDSNLRWNDIFKISKNTYEAIRSLPWLGEFLAYQIAVDFGYARPDLYDESVHVVAGPWCKRGIDRLFLDRWGLSHEEAIAWLVDHQEEGFASAWVDPDVLFSDRKNPRLNLMAIENCLCEISKYLKVRYGEGRPRNKYAMKY